MRLHLREDRLIAKGAESQRCPLASLQYNVGTTPRPSAALESLTTEQPPTRGECALIAIIR